MYNLLDIRAAISTLSKMVIHDPTLYDHSASVAMMSGIIAKSCVDKRIVYKDLVLVAQCGLYHDVGKTCIPSNILNKPAKFIPEEYEIMKQHAALGEKELREIIACGTPLDPLLARVAGEHHERFCGHGYPHGKKGREEEDSEKGIHLFTRIVTIADVYSALLMERVYKPAYSPQEAIDIMSKVAPDDFDPKIWTPFLKMVTKTIEQTAPSTNTEATLRYTEGQISRSSKKVS